MPNLLPDMGAAESVTMPRIHALRSAALLMAGRQAEAVTAAGLSQTPQPRHTPGTIARRGGPEAGQTYQEARDRYLAAFRVALAFVQPIESQR